MEKLNHAKAAGLAKEAAVQLRAVTEERDFLKEKVAKLELRQECEKIATVMRSKGVSDEPIESLVESLEKKAEAGQLEAFATGLDMVGPDMWKKFASPQTDENKNQGGDVSGFESVIMSLGQRHRIQGESVHVHSQQDQLRAHFGHPGGSPSGLPARRSDPGPAAQPGGSRRWRMDDPQRFVPGHPRIEHRGRRQRCHGAFVPAVRGEGTLRRAGHRRHQDADPLPRSVRGRHPHLRLHRGRRRRRCGHHVRPPAPQGGDGHLRWSQLLGPRRSRWCGRHQSRRRVRHPSPLGQRWQAALHPGLASVSPDPPSNKKKNGRKRP